MSIIFNDFPPPSMLWPARSINLKNDVVEISNRSAHTNSVGARTGRCKRCKRNTTAYTGALCTCVNTLFAGGWKNKTHFKDPGGNYTGNALPRWRSGTPHTEPIVIGSHRTRRPWTRAATTATAQRACRPPVTIYRPRTSVVQRRRRQK